MCRWLAYTGSPVLIHDALYTPAHSLIDQSLHSRLGAEPTNGDGFGVGWYDGESTPGVFRSIEPAWNDENLRELAGHVRSHMFFTHIRAAIGSPVQQTNCHPFRHGHWLWMHNGFIDRFADDQTRPRARRRRIAVSRDQGRNRLRSPVLPGPDVSALRMTLLPRSPARSASSRSAGDNGESSIRFRARSLRATANACGRFGTRARVSRARCSSPVTSRPSGTSIPTGRFCNSSQMTRD